MLDQSIKDRLGRVVFQAIAEDESALRQKLQELELSHIQIAVQRAANLLLRIGLRHEFQPVRALVGLALPEFLGLLARLAVVVDDAAVLFPLVDFIVCGADEFIHCPNEIGGCEVVCVLPANLADMALDQFPRKMSAASG